MTRFKRGIKRAVAGFLAAVICALSPMASYAAGLSAAGAAAVVLTSVGLSTAICAYMQYSGIYPFDPDGEQTFTQWAGSSMQGLIDKYNATSPSTPINSTTVQGFHYDGAVVFRRQAANALRGFLDWFKTENSVVDNQVSGEVVISPGQFVELPVISDVSWASLTAAGGKIQLSDGNILYIAASVPDCYIANVGFLTTITTDSSAKQYFSTVSPNFSGTGDVSSVTIWSSRFYVDFNNPFLRVSYSTFSFSGVSMLSFSSLRDFAASAYGRENQSLPELEPPVTFRYDTTTVSIPDEVPEGQDYLTLIPVAPTTTVIGSGSVSIPDSGSTDSGSTDSGSTDSGSTDSGSTGGSGSGSVGSSAPITGTTTGVLAAPAGSVEAVQQIIQEGVQAREQPHLIPAEIAMPLDATITTIPAVLDPTTGLTVTPEQVVVTPGEISVSWETALPSYDSESYETPDLYTKWPFNIPFSVYSVLSALRAPPVRPSFQASVHIPLANVDVPVTIDVPEAVSAQVDAFASLFRKLLLVVMCVGTCIFFYERVKF